VRGGLAAIALATLAMAFSENPLLWLLLRFAAGIASAWVLVHVSAYSLRRLHARLSGTVYAGVGAGIALAGFVCLAFMAQGIASRQAWIALGAIALVLSVAVWRFFDRPEAAPLAAAHQPLGAQARRLVLCYGAYGFGYIIPATFIPAIARELIPDPLLFGWAWPVLGIAAAASTLLSAAALERIGALRLWIWAQWILAIGVAAPLVLPGFGGILFAALCVGGTFVVITMVGLQEARSVAGARAPRLMAAMTAAFAAGQIAGPLSVSFVVGAGGGFAAALLVACAALVAGAALLLRR
jgi:MFS family permease